MLLHVQCSIILNGHDMETTDEWMKKMSCTYMQQNITKAQDEEILPFGTTSRMDLEDVLLSEIDQTLKKKNCMVVDNKIDSHLKSGFSFCV